MILSGHELFAQRKQQNLSLPQKAGVKDYAPDGSQLQQAKLEGFLLDRRDALAEPRVQKIGSVVRGLWNKKMCLIEFEQELGKFWLHMGFIDAERKWLYPEEGLFLMETNVLEVRYCGLPMSLQEAYAAFLGHSISLDQYQVYAHLRRLGYVLRRCDSVNERRQRGNSKKGKHKLKTDDGTDHPNDLSKKKCVSDYANDNVMDVSETMPAEHLSAIASRVVDISDESAREQPDFLDNRNTTFISAVEPPDLSIPNIAGLTQEFIQLRMPPSHLLPHTLSSNGDNSFITIEIRRQRGPCKEERLEFSFEAFNTQKVKADNWTEYKYKTQTQKRLHDQVVSDCPVAHLWKGEVTPLIKPQDAQSTADILNKLQIIENIQALQTERDLITDQALHPNVVGLEMTTQFISLTDLLLSVSANEKKKDPLTSYNGYNRTGSEPEVKFEVYLPDAKFKKVCPGKPNHRICVLSASDPTPSLTVLTSISQQFIDDVPVHWAVIDNGDIAFYSFYHVDLPVQCD